MTNPIDTAHRFRRAASACTLFALLALSACAARPVGYSDFDPETDFSGYRSFAWMSAHPLYATTPDPVNPALEGILMEEVKANLTRRGYTFVADAEQADFVLAFTIGSRAGMSTNLYPGLYRQSYTVGRGWGDVVATNEFTEAALVIDLFDRASAQKKWMGWSLTEITMNDRMNARPAVRELVDTILDHFPPD